MVIFFYLTFSDPRMAKILALRMVINYFLQLSSQDQRELLYIKVRDYGEFVVTYCDLIPLNSVH